MWSAIRTFVIGQFIKYGLIKYGDDISRYIILVKNYFFDSKEKKEDQKKLEAYETAIQKKDSLELATSDFLNSGVQSETKKDL